MLREIRKYAIFSLTFALCLVISLSIPKTKRLFAQDKDFVEFDIGFSSEYGGGVFPLAYVSGKIAGIVPGILTVPVLQQGAPVEIGFPQMVNGPLYSFVVDKKVMEIGLVKVVYSQAEVDIRGEYKGAWERVSINPNSLSMLNISKSADGRYRLDLPIQPLNTIREFLDLYNVSPGTADWNGRILESKNKGVSGGIMHTVYHPDYDGPVLKTAGIGWSGIQKFFDRPIRFGILDSPTLEHWNIRSVPDGARIFLYGDEQDDPTNVSVEVDVYANFSIVLERNGYHQCPYRLGDPAKHEYCSCSKRELDGVQELDCTLSQLQTSIQTESGL